MGLEGFEVNEISKTYYDERQKPFQVLHEISFHWPGTEKAVPEKVLWHASLPDWKLRHPGKY